MTRVRYCTILVIGLLSSRGARAQPAVDPAPPAQASPTQLTAPADSPQPEKATSVGYVAPIVPTLKVTASTTGKSDFQIGIDILRGLSARWDLHVLPSLRATTDGGTGDLFQFSNGKLSSGAPWMFGVTVAFSKLALPEPLSQRMADRKVQRAVARKAAAACLARCGAEDITDDEKTFCQANQGRTAADLVDLDPGDLCAGGKAMFAANFTEDEVRQARLFPQWDISAGFELGLSEMQYLVEQPGNGPDAPKMYTEDSRAASSMTGALAVTYVRPEPGYGFTLELPLSAGHRWDAQQTVGQYCPSSGSVGDAPIVTCSERPVGAPAQNFVVNAAVLAGVVDTDHAYWRIAAGPMVNYKSTNNEVHAGIEIPLYLNTTSLIADKSQYQGVIRLTPTFGMSYDSKNGRAFEAVLTIDLLGQRNLFFRALDWKH